MKFQLTCFVDETLLGPVTELLAPYSKIIVSLKEEPASSKPPPTKLSLPVPRRRYHFSPGKGMGAITVLQTLVMAGEKGMHVQEIKKAMRLAGANPTGSGAILSKMAQRGYDKRIGDGVWAITPKGEVAVKRMKTFNQEWKEEAERERQAE